MKLNWFNFLAVHILDPAESAENIYVISKRNYTYLINFPRATQVSLSNLCIQGQGDFVKIQICLCPLGFLLS